ncbi:MAG: 2'-5' RNA ligase family protein [Dactylosporangium sp.]|nr:2'-5' RNA ligase family protein [Dactylosporangium sp.]NNJ61625.1 2'-5' RNA ligase family protein [Dactylosporangium sp.]
MRRAAAGDPEAAHLPAHLTLLGPTDVDSTEIPVIDRHLLAVAERHEPFWLLLRGTGTFRPVTQVVFVAVAKGISNCERLHRAVLTAPVTLRSQRFPYHPHVTVAHDVAPDQLDAVFADLAGFQAEFEVTGFTLFEHTPEGHWREQRVYKLGGPRDGLSSQRRR